VDKKQDDSVEANTAAMFEVPELWSDCVSASISGVDSVVGLCAEKMKLFVNDKLFSNRCTSFFVS